MVADHSLEAQQPAVPESVDVLVIGGGVNGCGVAADAAGRGLRVLLCERDDLGGATSSASSKLIHGGLRYLEHYAFGMVRQALIEREILLQAAPHIIWPLRLRLPHRPGLRPRWLIGLGLWLYDRLSWRNTLPRSGSWVARAEDHLRATNVSGFTYSDCWVDDARLVICNALQAQRLGAVILPRTSCHTMAAIDGGWQVTLRDRSGEDTMVRARAVVNATGPWAQVTRGLGGLSGGDSLRLVKGSHIVVERMHAHDDAYLLQHPDGRVVFVLPFQQDFSLIGTTEAPFSGDPAQVEAGAEEIDYLLDIANTQFDCALGRQDIVYQYAGVRPLLDSDGAADSRLSRDYRLTLDMQPAPLLNVWGGKLTTYRRLAETAMQQLRPLFPDMGDDWTASASLPGAEGGGHGQLIASWRNQYPWLPLSIMQRWAQSYGALGQQILGGCAALDDLGEHFGHGLYARELDYLLEQEWAIEVDDVLWRRTKLGLHFSSAQRTKLAQVMADHPAAAGRRHHNASIKERGETL